MYVCVHFTGNKRQWIIQHYDNNVTSDLKKAKVDEV